MQTLLDGLTLAGRGGCCRDSSFDALHHQVHGVGEQVGLRWKEVAQGPRRQPGLGGDGANRCTFDTIATDDPPHGLGQVAPAGVAIKTSAQTASSTTVLSSLAQLY